MKRYKTLFLSILLITVLSLAFFIKINTPPVKPQEVANLNQEILDENLALAIAPEVSMSYKDRQHYLSQVPFDLNHLSCNKLEQTIKNLQWQQLSGVTRSAAYAFYDELLTLYRSQNLVTVDQMLATLQFLAEQEIHDFTTRDYAIQHLLYFQPLSTTHKVETYKLFKTQAQKDLTYQFLLALGNKEINSNLSGCTLNSLAKLAQPLALDEPFPYEEYNQLLTNILINPEVHHASYMTACQLLAQQDPEQINAQLTLPEVANPILQKLNSLKKNSRPSVVESLALIYLLKASKNKQWLDKLKLLKSNKQLPTLILNQL